MSKFTVYRCDRCQTALSQEFIPNGWKFAHLSDQESSSKLEIMTPRLLWCESCLKWIRQVLPSAK